jgi:hypothetical protein
MLFSLQSTGASSNSCCTVAKLFSTNTARIQGAKFLTHQYIQPVAFSSPFNICSSRWRRWRRGRRGGRRCRGGRRPCLDAARLDRVCPPLRQHAAGPALVAGAERGAQMLGLLSMEAGSSRNGRLGACRRWPSERTAGWARGRQWVVGGCVGVSERGGCGGRGRGRVPERELERPPESTQHGGILSRKGKDLAKRVSWGEE